MGRTFRIIPALVCTWVCLIDIVQGQAPESKVSQPVAADFKLKIKLLGPTPEPIATAELLYSKGTYYHFTNDSDEILIIEPARQRVELIDLKRRMSTQVSFKRMDDYLVKLKSVIAGAIEKREKSESRADRVAAEQSRSLVEPKFSWTLDASKRILSAKNEHVEVTAKGEPEADAARLAAIRLGLDTITRLGSLRSPGDIPPFARLEATAALADRQLRPTELNFLFRLSGPSQRLRWTYEFVDHLTDRERDAFGRIGRLRELAAPVRLERYDTREAK